MAETKIGPQETKIDPPRKEDFLPKTDAPTVHHPNAHHHHQEKPLFGPVHVIIAVLLGVVLLFNAYQIGSVTQMVAPPPLPEVKLTLITVDCEQCVDLSQAIPQLQSQKGFKLSDVQTLPSSDAHSQKLINDHQITHLPALVLEGETDKVTLDGFVKSGDALVYQPTAPYYDVKKGAAVGIVDLSIIPAPCEKCTNVTQLPAQLEQLGLAIGKVTTLSGADADRVISAYGITKLPAVVLSADAKEYPVLVESWSQAGDIAPDGMFVLRNINPPYYDLSKKKIIGLLDITYLSAASCTTCYNVSIHKLALQNLGVNLDNEKNVDVASVEGKALVAKYGIALVPTVVITGEADKYATLVEVWKSVGTVESDGAYIFRHPELLQGAHYLNLTSGATI
jgi:hypothetical protein